MNDMTPAQREAPLWPATFEDVRADLEAGLAAFRGGLLSADGGRAGLRMTLGAIHRLIGFGNCVPSSASHLLEPFYHLLDVLDDLDRGTPNQMVKAKPVSHRRIARAEVRKFKTSCIAAANLLIRHGGMTTRVADRMVLERVKDSASRLGIKTINGKHGEQGMTESHIETWRREVRKERTKAKDDAGFEASPLASFLVPKEEMSALRLRILNTTVEAEVERLLCKIAP
jgi:hypothetical protein